MNFLRSSPFLPAASLLQVVIFDCCVVSFLALRHSFMKALRSSPFLSLASALQVAILVCCLVLPSAGAAAAGLAAYAPPMDRARPRVIRETSFFMAPPQGL